MKRTIKLQPYVVAIVLIALVFSALNYFLVNYVRTLFLGRLEEESLNYASIYSHSLVKSREAYSVINELLEDRLITATATTALFSDQMDDAALQALANSLSVDEIYLYNPQGVIEYSTTPAYLGWAAEPGHPVHNFMISGAHSLVEDIRRDSESDRYYKYAYVRLDDGRFVQLGIDADLVQGFLSSFELQRIVGEIGSFHLVDHVCFLGPDFTVLASSTPDHVGLHLDDTDLREAVLAGRSYSQINRENGEETYDIYVPVQLDGEFVGTLVVGKSTDSTLAVMRTTTLLVFAGTSFVCLIFIYTMFANFRHNQQLVSLAYHDSLTGLPNKVYLEEVLTEWLWGERSDNGAFLLVHCRNLSEVNSVYGFDAGDRLMAHVSERLSTLVEGGRRLFRFSGSRFAFLVQGYSGREELIELAEHIRAGVEEGPDPIGHHLEVGTGIVELSDSHTDPVDVLTQAAVAVQHLENTPSAPSYAFFDVEMGARLRREEIIAQELRRFVGNPGLGTVYLHYQPKVAVSSLEVVGFEALSRMNSPSLGMVSPAEFIPIAERHGLIVPLGYWVLESACDFIRRLNHCGHGDLHVGVNISVLQLVQEDFSQRVGEILRDAGIEPRSLQLEITESVLIEDFAGVEAKLLPLRDLGVSIALDDFGTGYSALSGIEELPIDCIKIDKRFIDNILVKDKHRLVIKDLISMCHKLGLKVVAEGVEEEVQLRYLAESGCDVMQGYLYSKPLVEEEALAKLAS
jgi:diguanylate cyclase (GGDEF)-like protein